MRRYWWIVKTSMDVYIRMGGRTTSKQGEAHRFATKAQALELTVNKPWRRVVRLVIKRRAL